MKRFNIKHGNGVVFSVREDKMFGNWRDLNICFFDLEATGRKTDDADVVQFCGIVVTDLTTDDFTLVAEEEFLIKPAYRDIGDSQEIHNIGPEDVKDEPTFQERGEQLYQFCDAYVDLLVAWNGLGYDMPLLNQQYERYFDKTEVMTWPCFDPLVVERNRRGKMSGNSLKATAKRHGAQTLQDLIQQDGDLEGALHDARQDVTLMIDVVQERLETYYYSLHQMLKIQKQNFEKQQAYLRDKYGD